MKKTYSILVLSANTPSKAEPSPPIPKANPQNNPEIIPTLPGNSSCAYTKMAEKAEARIIAIRTDTTTTQQRTTCASNKVKGAAPKIDTQLIGLRPYLSPKGPPSSVPTATAARTKNKYIWD